MTEQDYEKLLNIKTTGDQKVFYDSLHYHRYEPTAYSWLDTLCKNYDFKPTDQIIDFGCGKGRLNFYLNYYTEFSLRNQEICAKRHRKKDKYAKTRAKHKFCGKSCVFQT